MANTTINGLTTALAATMAADDLLPIWDTSAAAMKKHAASYLARSDGAHKVITGSGRELTVPATGTAAVLDQPNVFTAAQTTPQLKPASTSLADSAVHAVGAASFGVLLVENASSGAQALIWCGGGANVVASISIRGGITTTKDSAGNVNVYYDSGYKIQNKTGGTITIYYLLIGT